MNQDNLFSGIFESLFPNMKAKDIPEPGEPGKWERVGFGTMIFENYKTDLAKATIAHVYAPTYPNPFLHCTVMFESWYLKHWLPDPNGYFATPELAKAFVEEQIALAVVQFKASK